MKWMIASDLHGSEYYCKKLLEAYDMEKADRLLFLGDLLYHGPRNNLPREYQPQKVLELLNQRKDDILCVRGNCDGEVDQMVLEFPIMADYCMIVDQGYTIFATHGHLYHEQKLPPLHKGDILLHGHTHVPTCKETENYTYLNPGSVSMPKEETWNGYLILDGGRFVWKDFDGTIQMEYKKNGI